MIFVLGERCRSLPRNPLFPHLGPKVQESDVLQTTAGGALPTFFCEGEGYQNMAPPTASTVFLDPLEPRNSPLRASIRGPIPLEPLEASYPFVVPLPSSLTGRKRSRSSSKHRSGLPPPQNTVEPLGFCRKVLWKVHIVKSLFLQKIVEEHSAGCAVFFGAKPNL